MKLTDSFIASILLCMSAAPAIASWDSDLLLRKAQSRANTKQYLDAIKLLRQAFAVDPSDPEIRRNLVIYSVSEASVLKSKNDFRGALKHLEFAKYLEPNSSRLEAKINEVITTLGLDPSKAATHRDLGKQAADDGRLMDAIVEYRLAYALSNDEAIRNALNAAVKTRTKDPTYLKAFDMRGLSSAMSPEYCVSKIKKAIEYRYFDPAEDWIERLESATPNYPQLCELRDDLASAKKKQAVELIAKASAAEKDGKLPKALHKYKSVISLDPDNAEAKSRRDELQKTTSEPESVSYAAYIKTMQSRIHSHWHPGPGHMLSRTKVLFRIHNDGSVSDILLFSPSGETYLDKMALNAIEKAAFPPLPDEEEDEIEIDFNFDYNAFGGGFRQF